MKLEAYDYTKISAGCLVRDSDDRIGILTSHRVTYLLRPDGKEVGLPVVLWEGNSFPAVCNPLMVEPAREHTREDAPKVWIKYLLPLENISEAIA